MEHKTKKTLIFSVVALLIILIVAILRWNGVFEHSTDITEELRQEERTLLYGLPADGYEIYGETIKSGESLSVILARYGVSAAAVDSLQRVSSGVFDVRSIRADKRYTAFVLPDTLSGRLHHLVYEKDPVNYVVMSFVDSIAVYTGEKEVTTERRLADLTISSSLWNAMMGAGLDPALAVELENVYAWTVDFFSLQKNDHFKVIYDENYVEGEKYGTGKIWGAWFDNGNKRYYAIPFGYDAKGKLQYWDDSGNSLRKMMLKAPLSYSRISSTFSNSRMHPVLRIRRAHHGVDYAAPSGTEVYAVADGVVTKRGWDGGGGGNMLRIKHVHGGFETAYLHLRGYAKGIVAGSRVSQGDLIGYVGSTGLSTGPHLDYRVYKNGVAIDPLKVPSEPVAPIDPRDSVQFNRVKGMVLGALDGQIALDGMEITGDTTLISWNSTPVR